MMGETKIEWTDKMKRCEKCHSGKSITSFPLDRTRADGHCYVCFECRRIPRENLLRHPIVDKLKANRIKYNRWYAKRGAPSVRQRVHARKRGVLPIPVVGQEHLMEWYDGKCAYCTKPATTFDHIVPISKGGKTKPGNIVSACVSCNSSKGAMNLDDWLDYKGITVSHLVVDVISLSEVYGG